MDTKEGISGNYNTQHQQKLEDLSLLDYSSRIELPFQGINKSSKYQSLPPHNSSNQISAPNKGRAMDGELEENKVQDWDPSMTLSNLSFLEQKVHQLQDLVHSIVGGRGQEFGRPSELVAQQQQLVAADLTSIIGQLISTAGSLLQSVKQTRSSAAVSVEQFEQLDGAASPSVSGMGVGFQLQNVGGSKVTDCWTEQKRTIEDHELKDGEDVDEGENLIPGTYEILQPEKEEILAPHTHFCAICGKGFKRDANLRMHMRGHGDEYKTPAALAKPHKESGFGPTLIKRYSCPYQGCKRNKDHKKFQPLKTILCVKNHYKRTHCDKRYTCSRCNTKKFSVPADLKTHEKHCGRDRWLCSCGTTFSRKDKLFGHIALFQGHTPAIPLEESKVSTGSSDGQEGVQATDEVGNGTVAFSWSNSAENMVESLMDVKETDDDPDCYFEKCRFHEFPRPVFDDSEKSFSFLLSCACNYAQETGGDDGSNAI